MDVIFLEESNVLETSEIIVYEERYKEDANIVLNKDQITNELTNLFINKYKLASKKIEAFIECFDNLKTEGTNLLKLHPVIKCRKYNILHGDKKDKFAEADEEFQKLYDFKVQKFLWLRPFQHQHNL